MKRIITIVMSVLTVLSFASIAYANTDTDAAFDPNTDYMALMIDAAVNGDVEAGNAAARARYAKIVAFNLEDKYRVVEFEDLYLLSKIIYAEAGSYWLPEEWKLAVGEVVLNRVASPEFPDTIAKVLQQPGQYYGANSNYFRNLRPSETCVKLALRLLEGERNMHPSVVFQANFRQGSGVHTAYYDRYLGWTFFCYSSRPSLYYV